MKLARQPDEMGRWSVPPPPCGSPLAVLAGIVTKPVHTTVAANRSIAVMSARAGFCMVRARNPPRPWRHGGAGPAGPVRPLLPADRDHRPIGHVVARRHRRGGAGGQHVALRALPGGLRSIG